MPSRRVLARRARGAVIAAWRQGLLRRRSAPSRFAFKRVLGATDWQLASRVLGVEPFRTTLQPAMLAIDGTRTVAVLAPHADDEVIGAGGTLALFRDAGASIHCVYVTDSDQTLLPDATETRRAEAAAVCRRLNATMHEVGVPNRLPVVEKPHVEALAGLLREIAPDLILAPWILDAPAKHRMVNHLLALASPAAPAEAEIWGYQVHNVPLVNGVVDITGVADEKRQLMELYESQLAGYQRYDHIALGVAAWNSRYLGNASTPRYAEVFCCLNLREHTRVVDACYASDLEGTYLGSPVLVRSFRALRGEKATV